MLLFLLEWEDRKEEIDNPTAKRVGTETKNIRNETTKIQKHKKILQQMQIGYDFKHYIELDYNFILSIIVIKKNEISTNVIRNNSKFV